MGDAIEVEVAIRNPPDLHIGRNAANDDFAVLGGSWRRDHHDGGCQTRGRDCNGATKAEMHFDSPFSFVTQDEEKGSGDWPNAGKLAIAAG